MTTLEAFSANHPYISIFIPCSPLLRCGLQMCTAEEWVPIYGETPSTMRVLAVCISDSYSDM